MTIVKNIRNSWQYALGSKIIAYHDNNTLLFKNNLLQELFKVKLTNGLNRIALADNKAFILDENNFPIIISLIDFKSLKLDIDHKKSLLPNQNFENEFLLIQDNIDILHNVNTGLLSIKKNCIQFYSNDFIPNNITEDIVLAINTKEISRFRIDDGSKMWSLSLIKDHTFMPILLGKYKNYIYIYIYNFIVIADLNTGALLHQISFKTLFNGWKNEFGTDNLHLDKEKGILKGLAYRYYFEIDLNTLKGEIKKDFGADLKNSWRITRSRFYEGDKNLYFIGALHGEAVNRAVGIFDTEQCEIVWYDEPLEEKKFLFYVEPPQRNDEILAVLDSDNNLHIYDR